MQENTLSRSGVGSRGIGSRGGGDPYVCALTEDEIVANSVDKENEKPASLGKIKLAEKHNIYENCVA